MIAWLHKFGRRRPADTLAAPASSTRGGKPRVRIRSDGWIRHQASGFPFSPMLLVEVTLAGGTVIGNHLSDYAGSYPDSWWRGRAPVRGNNIQFYRIVGEPPQ